MSEIVFVLPVTGGGGGAHSVVQEVAAMRQLGVEASIAINERNFAAFSRTYSRLKWLDRACFSFSGPKDLGEKLSGAQVAVATTNTSVHSLAEARGAVKGSLRCAYYVQDYEPLFYEPKSEAWNISLASFSLIPDCTYFAKTRWLRDFVNAVHQHDVALVTPSIDHTLYHPERNLTKSRHRSVCAMVRPSTPRRAPLRTMRILGRLASQFGSDTDFFAFGASETELRDHQIPRYDGVEILGKLSQPEVAELLQQSDFFLDLSDYQAFGRTAAEAMACGAIVLAPSLGGTSDFIKHAVNSFLVDTTDEAAILDEVQRMLALSAPERLQIGFAAVEAVDGFTPTAAAVSELRVLLGV